MDPFQVPLPSYLKNATKIYRQNISAVTGMTERVHMVYIPQQFIQEIKKKPRKY